MDATSSPVRPDLSYIERLLLEAPMVPHASTALVSAWLGLHGTPSDLDAVRPWLLVVLGLGLRVAARGPRRMIAGWLVAVCGLAMAAGIHGRPPDLAPLRLDGPVEVEGTVASHLRGVEGERWLWLRVGSVVQGRTRIDGDFDVLVGLPESTEDSGPSLAKPAWRQPAWGQEVLLKGYLKRSPALDNGFETRGPPWRLSLPSWRFWRVKEEPPRWQTLAAGLRAAASERLGCGLGRCSPGSELRQALLLGDAAGLPERWRRALRATGLSHLLAVSGLHVGLVGGLVWLLAMPLGHYVGNASGRRSRLLLSLTAVAAYLLLVGPKPSAVRAAGMGGLMVAASWIGRPPQALNAAALWATILTLWRPQILDDLGFRLSVAATVGILVLAPPFAATLSGLRWRGWQLPRWLAASVAVCLAAQLSTLPLLAPWTGLVHPLSWCLNLVAIPWLTAFLGLSLLSLAPLGVVSRGEALSAGMAARLDAAMVGLLDQLCLPLEALSHAPPSPVWTWPWLPTPALAWLLALGCGLAVLRPRRVLRLAAVALVLIQTGAALPEDRGPEAGLGFHRLDVGQGDAFLLRDGERTVLVDGGGWRRGDVAARVLVPALARRGVRRLDAFVLSHPDADHCHGLRDLSSYLPVAEVWASPGWRDDCAQELLARRGPAWRPLWAGRRGTAGRWRIDVLWPPAGSRPGAADNGNDGSLVLLARGGRQCILLTGDVGSRVERRLASRYGDGLRASVLGVPHHGSKTSTSAAFLRAVAPRLATIGVALDNPYGHPHASVVGRLESSDVLVHRTDSMGALDLRFRPDTRHSLCPDLQHVLDLQ